MTDMPFSTVKRPWIGKHASTGELLVREEGAADPGKVYFMSLQTFTRKGFLRQAAQNLIRELPDGGEYEHALQLYRRWPEAKREYEQGLQARRAQDQNDREQRQRTQKEEDDRLIADQVVVFRDDDRAYQRWRAGRSYGFVLNVSRSKRAKAAMLHGKDCPNIASHRNGDQDALTRSKDKVCSESRAALRAWFHRNVAAEGEWEPCRNPACGA